MPKRANGEGTIRKRKDGRWEAIVPYRELGTGKLKYKSLYAPTLREAREKRDAFLAALKELENPAAQVTLGEALHEWLTTQVFPRVRHTTRDKYAAFARNHIVPRFGQLPLRKITTEDIQSFYNTLSKTYASGTVALIHLIIRGCLSYAVKRRLIASNPAEDTTRPPVRCKVVEPLTAEEIQAYLKAAQRSKFYAAFLLAVTTGLREGELLALTWDDVDLENGLLRVNKTLTRMRTPIGRTRLVLSETKTPAARREVPLITVSVEALREHRKRQEQEKTDAHPYYSDRNLVFATPAGTPIDPRNFLRAHKLVLQKAGLRSEVTVHTLRHTFGTILARSGTSPETIQRLFGHTNIRTALSIYCHSTLEDKRRAVEAIASYVT